MNLQVVLDSHMRNFTALSSVFCRGLLRKCKILVSFYFVHFIFEEHRLQSKWTVFMFTARSFWWISCRVFYLNVFLHLLLNSFKFLWIHVWFSDQNFKAGCVFNIFQHWNLLNVESYCNKIQHLHNLNVISNWLINKAVCQLAKFSSVVWKNAV